MQKFVPEERQAGREKVGDEICWCVDGWLVCAEIWLHGVMRGMGKGERCEFDAKNKRMRI